ncbi:MAG TPA: helix-turn-helix domain-containing protein [Sphingomicrobium sp.]|nr:helix-turn-helix domain-containing protein [Sphingomicrobium sp.]
MTAGDVVVHRPYERHLDRFSTQGAEVLVLPLPQPWPKSVLARVDDADLIARLAIRDVVAAKEALVDVMVERPPTVEDWPDLLALDLLADPDLSLSTWATEHGLHPGSLGRGFGQQFDVSPAGFRALVRTRRAIEHIVSTKVPLSAIASEQGFSDQAHMSRAVKHITGHPPFSLRRAFAGSDKGEQRAA